MLKNKLNKSFYTRDVITVAREVLGKIFVNKIGDVLLSGKVVEVEAYHGATDKSAHSYNGITKRNNIMFETGGLLYVYFIYGIHNCCNIVTGKQGEGDAILIRGIEPLSGIEKMSFNRYKKNNISNSEKLNLSNGPGKICQAFKINRDQNGINLTGNQIYLLNNKKIKEEEIISTKRIGIKRSEALQWRFYIKNNQYVSKK
ncbi:MAG: DNA-3-methyladenine glycosylase [Candidatus Marinimicrobia bacterium]|nr:DNA-3-methyladenine glycosylase [Candidatus Neomarinimicrobiota bacterium]